MGWRGSGNRLRKTVGKGRLPALTGGRACGRLQRTGFVVRSGMVVENRVRALIGAAQKAYGAQVDDERGRASVARVFTALGGALRIRKQTPERLPVCAHLDEVTDPAVLPNGLLRDLVQAFLDLEPYLKWYQRSGDATNANDAYWGGHANAMIVGPGGLVKHDRIWLGVSLLGPGVRYPDHTHPPEETYLVLSEGEFSQDGVTWFTPGVGGTFYNPPGILHAMRTDDAPLFAMWALWAGEGT